MDHFGTLEAKNRFSELVDRAARGEEVVITRHGKPVAKLVAATESDDQRRLRLRSLGRELLAARRGVTTGGLGWRALRDEGRR